MAVSPIAGATCAGKSAFDRPTILCSAHAAARSRMANNRAWRSYRHAFADALRMEWRRAKDAAAQAAAEAADITSTLPPDVIALTTAIRTAASYEPFTSAGAALFRALQAEADDVARAARLIMIPANDRSIHER